MIRFDSVTKKYHGTTRPALNGIDLEILRGEFVFLVGASGSGKSSCLRLMLKEEKPTTGQIHVLGQNLGSISARKIPYFRRNLGVVFQDFRLLPGKTVYQNVAFTLQVIGKSRGFVQEAVPDVLKLVGLDGKAQRLPHELSGGEQQRVAIARAIVNKPQVLLADEPTGNLDPVTSAGIMALLDRINANGTTIVMATHEAGIVDQMKRRVIELSAGQIVRDERQGGYTTAIPTVVAAEREVIETADAEASALAEPEVAVAVAETGPVVAGPKVPLAVMENARPLYVEPEVTDEVIEAAAAVTAAATAAIAIEPAAPAPPPMNRPVLPVAADADVPEQLTLAEKLGLRAPGGRHNDTGDQEVGPTR